MKSSIDSDFAPTPAPPTSSPPVSAVFLCLNVTCLSFTTERIFYFFLNCSHIWREIDEEVDTSAAINNIIKPIISLKKLIKLQIIFSPTVAQIKTL